MTTISNLNIVLQQEGGAREAQNIRHAVNDQSHVVSADQKEKDIRQQTTVQQSNQSEETKTERDPSKKRKRKRKSRRSIRGAAGASEQKRLPGEAGKLVDTVA
ncbi:MAG TPA: hypothetical protein HPQ03_02845 [Deltaproteobacteria bacterium]|nr:hypothetical protein [Deltaproteobacteria bacterium]